MLGWVVAGKTLLANTETEKEFLACRSHNKFNQMCLQEVLDSDYREYFMKSHFIHSSDLMTGGWNNNNNDNDNLIINS